MVTHHPVAEKRWVNVSLRVGSVDPALAEPTQKEPSTLARSDTDKDAPESLPLFLPCLKNGFGHVAENECAAQERHTASPLKLLAQQRDNSNNMGQVRRSGAQTTPYSAPRQGIAADSFPDKNGDKPHSGYAKT